VANLVGKGWKVKSLAEIGAKVKSLAEIGTKEKGLTDQGDNGIMRSLGTTTKKQR
jgi:hypothetical protein